MARLDGPPVLGRAPAHRLQAEGRRRREAETLHLEPGANVRAVRYQETSSWDSVAHLQLIDAVEQEFGVVIDGEWTSTLVDYEAFRRLIGESSSTADPSSPDGKDSGQPSIGDRNSDFVV